MQDAVAVEGTAPLSSRAQGTTGGAAMSSSCALADPASWASMDEISCSRRVAVYGRDPVFGPRLPAVDDARVPHGGPPVAKKPRLPGPEEPSRGTGGPHVEEARPGVAPDVTNPLRGGGDSQRPPTQATPHPTPSPQGRDGGGAGAEPTGRVATSLAGEREGREPRLSAHPAPAGAVATLRPADESLEGENKRRRLEARRDVISNTAAAVDWMGVTFGENWRELFDSTHRLSLARPLAFCRRCGAHCDTPQHVVKLGKGCDGEPRPGSNFFYRLRKIMEGKHPTSGQALAGAVPLPFGTKSSRRE